jgi:hypothetical protein
VFINENIILLPSGNTARGIFVDNGSYSGKSWVQCHYNRVLMPSALNTPCIQIASNTDVLYPTASKLTMNFVEGNSTGALILQNLFGTLDAIGNTIVNNGAGGNAISGTVTMPLDALNTTGTITSSGLITAGGGLQIDGGTEADGRLSKSAGVGLVVRGITGSSFDFNLVAPGGTGILRVPTGTTNLAGQSTTDATSTSAAALVTAGGLGVAKKLYLGDDLYLASGKVYRVNGVQVLGAQQTGMGATLASGTAGATYTATEQTMLQALNAKVILLEAALKVHGLVAN